jgi:hypothetical protein
MKQKSLLLFEFFLALCAFYALLHYSGTQRFLVSLACLVAMLVVGKAETSLTQPSTQRISPRTDTGEKDETQIRSRALTCVLRSKNVLLLTDAIHYLMQDLGLAVSPSPDHPAVARLISIPDIEGTFGLRILGDVGELNASRDSWEQLASFDLGKGGKRRLLIIGSNFTSKGPDSQHRYRNFPDSSQKLLSARQMVAMTTLTICKIYMLCKKKGLNIKTVFERIQHHPGGVFHLGHY